MADAARPLPSLDDPDTRPFWEASRDQQLRYQICQGCKRVVFYPRQHCPYCLGLDLRWATSSGQGTIYSLSVVRRSRHPYFADKVPYAVAMVDLDEGFRMLSNIVGVADPGAELRIGQRVSVEWEEHESVSLPLFRLAEGGGEPGI